MNRKTFRSVPSVHQQLFSQIVLFLACAAFLPLAAMTAMAQRTHPGRGAISSQDLAKMAAMQVETTAVAGADPADLICARFAPGSATTAPAELHSVNGTLEVTLKFLTATDAQGLQRYCYVTPTGTQAPTLRVNPGDHLIIHFQNALPSIASASANMAGMKMTLSSDDAGSSNPCTGAMSADASNIHFHGLNVPPVCGQDEVVHTLVQPGQSFDYNVQIPANEPPGLYWYHPHPHGYSEAQVQGGATGALIVEGLQNVDPALAGLPERTLVVRDQALPAFEANDANIPAWDLSINFTPVTYPNYTPAVIQTTAGQQELWRVANTAADTILDLQYVVNGTAQAVQVVAIDGYPIAAGGSGQPSTSETTILVPPGARAEFVIATPNVGDKAQLVTQYWNTGPDGDFDPTRTLADVVSTSSTATSLAAQTAATGKLPAHVTPAKVTRFAALASATPVAQRNLYFSEVLQDPTNPNSPTSFFITQQGSTPAVFTMGQAPNIVVHSGTVEDWVIENHAGEDHIFHIHQIHFQVLEQNGQPVNDPAVRDTVDLPYWSGAGAYPSVKVRMDFRDPNIAGAFVYHCHILQHEDSGMMGEIQVLPSGLASAVTATASAASIAPNGSITLTANVVDGATGAALPTGSVQFEVNGAAVGNPVALANGEATLTTPINGAVGANSVTAFYMGDSTYTESVSAAIPLSISNFALTSPGVTAALGAAAIAKVTVNVANGYTAPINLTCALPAKIAEAACFVDPKSITGTGQVSLTVNTTPVHPLSSQRRSSANWFTASGGTTLACVLLLVFPRRWRGKTALVVILAAASVTLLGCGGAAKSDAGTATGNYTVIVTGMAGSGSTQYQTTVEVPITIQ